MLYRRNHAGLFVRERNIKLASLICTEYAVKAVPIEINETDSTSEGFQARGASISYAIVFLRSSSDLGDGAVDVIWAFANYIVCLNEVTIDIAEECSFRLKPKKQGCRSSEWFHIASKVWIPEGS
jgi:hypothetical protein